MAYDGITVMTSPANSAVTCLSFADLYALVGPESQGFDSWADAAAIATELGSTTTFPDAPLVITAPGEESGTFDYFNELRSCRSRRSVARWTARRRPDYTAPGNDNVIIEGIAGSDSSLGYVGFAFAQANDEQDQGARGRRGGQRHCVAPSPETISDGTYPLARPLFIYVNKAKAAENAAVAAYVDYYLAESTLAKVVGSVAAT